MHGSVPEEGRGANTLLEVETLTDRNVGCDRKTGTQMDTFFLMAYGVWEM